MAASEGHTGKKLLTFALVVVVIVITLIHDFGIPIKVNALNLYDTCHDAVIEPIHTDRILYNKVPKCGSTTLSHILKAAGDSNDFKVKIQDVFRGRLVNSTQESDFINYFNGLPERTLLHRHILLPDFPQYGSEYPSLINMVREPVNQLISNYYYIRSVRGFVDSMDQDDVKMTLDECVAKWHPSCMEEMGMIPFFCGQDPECRIRGPKALARAKHNICHHYDVVGYMENMRGFLEVIEYLYPNYFANVVDVYDKKVQQLHSSSSTKSRTEPEPNTLSILREHLYYDLELYEFVRARFDRQHEAIVRLLLS